jgi:hypothetical protein
MCISLGVTTDYRALVEKRHLKSLSSAEQSNAYAVRLLKSDPTFYDAYVTTGLSEYLVGSLPFFMRWFVHFDDIRGSKRQAVKNLELVIHHGRYLAPFAQIVLSIIDLREKRPEETRKLLADLARNYPGNPLFRQELARLRVAILSPKTPHP